MDIKRVTESNRKAWNEAIPIHRESREVDIKERFKEKGFICFEENEYNKLKELVPFVKKVAQLCCNNGRELLSLINMGIESGVGFDISDEAIKEAEELAEISKLKCSYIKTDVYNIGEEYYNAFDMIYISVGALNWLPDIGLFFKIASKMLKEKGYLFINEIHPFASMFACEGEKEFDINNPQKITYSYFRKEPFIQNIGIDYVGKKLYKSKPTYEFSHTLSNMLNSLIENGIRIKQFYEFADDISGVYEHLQQNMRIPLSYILIGKKEINLQG